MRERIVQLRELQKCIIQVRGMERGEGERDEGRACKKKRRSEIEALRAKNVGGGGSKKKHKREHNHLHDDEHHYSSCSAL